MASNVSQADDNFKQLNWKEPFAVNAPGLYVIYRQVWKICFHLLKGPEFMELFQETKFKVTEINWN